MADPKGFLKFSRKEPEKRAVHDRVLDYKEFYHSLPEAELREQGLRCMDCGVPFCQSRPYGCPVENLIPDFNSLIAEGRWREALDSLHSTNNFPEFTGKLCPAPCESACVLGLHSTPVSIRTIESSIVSRGFEEGWITPEVPGVRTQRRVAIIGSGPAGLAAAQQLARLGHSVTVYEKTDQPGGLLRYGIPDFKMEKSVLERRLSQMVAEGVEFKTQVDVGHDIMMDELRSSHDAVCLAIGAEQPRDLEIPGRDLQGIHFAMDYLVQQNRRGAGLAIEGPEISAQGKRVVILGGGDTGSDCLGTAHRQNCQEVMQFELMGEPPIERHESTPWPLWPMKLRNSHAHEEGGKRIWAISTLEFLGESGKVRALRAVQVRQTPGQAIGKLEIIPGTEVEIPADLVILALGFTGPRRKGLLAELGAKQDARGNLATDENYMTSVEGVFCAGDARRGASLIVWAIAEGRKMAAAVDRFLLGDAQFHPVQAHAIQESTLQSSVNSGEISR